MKFHNVANLMPMMTADEFNELKLDIQANGLIEPVWIHDGQIIDGRNRYLACKDLGIEPVTREYHGDDLVQFVLSLNVKRRHLNKAQLAFIALDLEEYYEKEAKERQGERTDLNLRELIPECDTGRARDKAGESVGVSGRYVSKAKKIFNHSPGLAEAVKKGWLSLSTAEEILADADDNLRHFQTWLFIQFGNKADKLKPAQVRQTIIDVCTIWKPEKYMDDSWWVHHFGDPESLVWMDDKRNYKYQATYCPAPHGEPYVHCCICNPDQADIYDPHFSIKLINAHHQHVVIFCEARGFSPSKVLKIAGEALG